MKIFHTVKIMILKRYRSRPFTDRYRFWPTLQTVTDRYLTVRYRS
jgi:hypothetical protein